MGLEKTILNEVAEVLQKDNAAGFTNGCLFVHCDEAEARQLFHRFTRRFGTGRVLINGPIQGEYAYDFI